MAKIGPKQHLTTRVLREKWRLESKAKSAVNSAQEPPVFRTDGKKVRHKKRPKLASPTSMQWLNGFARKKKKLDDDTVQATSLKNLDSLFEEMKNLFGVPASAEEIPNIEDAYNSLEARFPSMLITPPNSRPDIYTLVARKKEAATPSRPDNMSSIVDCSREESVADAEPWTTSDPSNLVSSCDTPTLSAPFTSVEPATPPQTPEMKPQLFTASPSAKHISALTPLVVQSGSTSHPVDLDAASSPDQELQIKRSRNLSATLPDNTTKLSPTYAYTSESLAREQAVILEMIARRNSERTPSPSIEDIRSELREPSPCSHSETQPNSKGTPFSSIEPPEDIRSEPHKLTSCFSKTQPASASRLFTTDAGVSRPNTDHASSSTDTRSESSQLISKPLSSAFSTQPRLARTRSPADKHSKVNSSTRKSVDTDSQTRRSLGTLPSQTIATGTAVNTIGSTAFATNTKTDSSRKSIDVKEFREVPQNRSNLHILPRSVQFAAIVQNTSNPVALSLPSSTAQKSTPTSATTAGSVSEEPVSSASTISSSPANPAERASSVKNSKDRDLSMAYPVGFSETVGIRRKRSTSDQFPPVSALEDSTSKEDSAKVILPVDKAFRSIGPLHPRRSAGTITTSPPIRDKTSEPRPPVGTRLQHSENVEFAPLQSKNRPAFIFGSSSQGPTTSLWSAPSNAPTNEATPAPADEKSQSPELVNVFDYFRKRWTAGDDHIPYTPPAKEKREKAELPSDGNGESVMKKEVKNLKKHRALRTFWR